MDGQLIVAQVHSTRLSVLPDTPHLVEVKNVTGPAVGFGDLFVYDDASQANVRVRAAQIRNVTLYPRQRYIRGIVNLACDIRGLGEGQVVVCRPTIDGTPMPDVAAGGQAQYHLDPGTHTVHIDLGGDQAGLWSPSAADHSVNVTAGRTTNLRSTYNRKGLLTINLNVANVVGDIYVDGVLVASQVPSVETYVAPSVNHTIEAKGLSVTDPAAVGLYRYKDVSAPGWVGANQARTVTLRPKQVWLVGYAAVTCQLVNKLEADDARCDVTADGQPLGPVEHGATGTFNLVPGQHVVAVTVVGGSAHRWGIIPVSRTLNIVGGQTARYSAQFRLLPPTPTPVSTATPIPPPTIAPAAAPNCHPSYQGNCLTPGIGDYDCAGGSGNGPNYTGRVTVVGPDVYDLDRDHDGVGCE